MIKSSSAKVAIVGGGPVGLYLSHLLSRYGVAHTLIEKRTDRRARPHPQAHYLNMRTMELLRNTYFEVFEDAVIASPPSFYWKDFAYVHSVTGVEYARHNTFSLAPPHAAWDHMSPTSVLHLAQHTFEDILWKHHSLDKRNLAVTLMGHEGLLVKRDANGCDLLLRSANSSTTTTFDYVIATDGAGSKLRQALLHHDGKTASITMTGKREIQHLINVHFTCPGLSQYLAQQQKRPAMLYFVFHEAMIAVYVSHDPQKDEWVCQIPYFPPFQELNVRVTRFYKHSVDIIVKTAFEPRFLMIFTPILGLFRGCCKEATGGDII